MTVALARTPATERPQTALVRPVLSPVELTQLHQATTKYIQETLVEGRDYGTVKGAKKPSLYKAGAELMCIGFALIDDYEIIEKEIDHNFRNEWQRADKRGEVYAQGVAFGLYRYTLKCRLRRGEDGLVVGEGVGACSSLESKYMDRPRDSENTILKMAKKRAKADAVLSTLGLSDRFTQDVEDMDRPVEDEEGHATERPNGKEIKPEKPAAEKAFPMKGPFQGKPIGEMPLDAITGYIDWIRKKQAEKEDETFFADLLSALVEVAAAKKAEAERDQTKLELESKPEGEQRPDPTSSAATSPPATTSTATAAPTSSSTPANAERPSGAVPPGGKVADALKLPDSAPLARAKERVQEAERKAKGGEKKPHSVDDGRGALPFDE